MNTISEAGEKTLYFETIPFMAGDGKQLNLKHVVSANKPSKGPVLLVHGAGVRANIFSAPVKTTLVEYLSRNGYDVWLENWRANIDLEPNQWTLDQAAVYDHPQAVNKVIQLTGARSIKAVIHCQGSTSFMMSAVAGLVPKVDTIISNAISLHPIVPPLSRLKINLSTGLIQRLTPYLNPQWLKDIGLGEAPFMSAFLPDFEGSLDDHFECWFLTDKDKITTQPEGLEMTYPLGYEEDWPPPPTTTEAEQQSTEEQASAGITFSETMAGGLSLGEDDPEKGAKQGRAKGNILAMHATIRIEDMEKFISDPDHCGSITGHIDFTPFGISTPATSGKFNLFNPTDIYEIKYMVYEFGFSHEDKNYYLAGRKEVKQDPGLDLWPDTTTLYCRLFEGTSVEGTQIGSGILSLGIKDLLAMVSTFKPINSSSLAESPSALNKFGLFFMGELWDSYRPRLCESKKTKQKEPSI